MSDPASSSSITRYLASSRTALVLYGSLAAFGAYFCMYAFRKPVAALTYVDLPPGALFGAGALEPKTLFLLSQLFGYCLSKYLGTRICAEVGRPRLGAYLTAYRDYRDNYQADIFLELGIADPAAFSRTERPVAVIVLATLAVFYFIRNNIAALATTYGVMIAGFALLAGATVLYDRRTISPEIWMTCTGLGAYLAYVPFGAILFDRTIAVTRFTGTAVFAIYLADASGYTGSFAIQLYKDLFAAEADRLQFFRTITYALATIGIPLLVLAMAYFLRQKPPSVTEPTP